MQPLVSVIIPSVRDTSLNEKCLKWQIMREFEVIIVRPQGKRKGYFYSLNEDMNRGIRQANGELIISYQDMIEIKPDTLERFFQHYKDDKKVIVGAVGDQYSSLEPPVKVWQDPRRTTQYGTYYECHEVDVEYTLAAIPRQAFYDVGGFDEEWDRYAAISEKEINARMYKAGYKFYLDQAIEYKAIQHPRLHGKEEWDKHYFAGEKYYLQCIKEIGKGKRLKLDYLRKNATL